MNKFRNQINHIHEFFTGMKGSFLKDFHVWWQLPRKAGDPHLDRRVSFLELFYDLVYVVLIAQLSLSLSEHVSISGIGSFSFLFIFVVFAWTNGTIYHDLHGNNDVRTRLLTFLQMFTVASMAIFINTALGDGSAGFALSYAAFLVILTYMWWCTGSHDPDHRILRPVITLVYSISILLFTFSIFVPMPLRFYVWAIGLVLCVLYPLILLVVNRNNERAQRQIDMVYSFSSAAVERFGSFVIILLGGVIVSVIQGVIGLHYLDWTVGITALLGMVISIQMWWIYFDFVSYRLPLTTKPQRYIWLYLHLPVYIGIPAAGAGLLSSIAHAGVIIPHEARWLLVVAIGITLVSDAFLIKTLQIYEKGKEIYNKAFVATLASGAFIILLGFFSLSTLHLLIFVILLMLIPTFFGLRVSVATSLSDINK